MNYAALRALWTLASLTLSPVAVGQVVILIHPKTGATVLVVNEPDALKVARERAERRARGGGWETALESDAPGYGAMFCFRRNQRTERFVAEARGTAKEAITQARSDAYAAAPKGETPHWCGAWNNKNAFDLVHDKEEVGFLGDIKVTITSGSVASGDVAHVNLVNTSSKAAYAVEIGGLERGRPTGGVLQPGHSMNLPVGRNRNFSIRASEVPDGALSPTAGSLFDRVQDYIEIQVTGGKFQDRGRQTPVGVRG